MTTAKTPAPAAPAAPAAPHVYAAINAVMKKMAKDGIEKGRRNQQQGYNFRGIDEIYNALCGVMADEKLFILPSVVDMDREERATARGGVLIYTILTVDFTFVSAVDGSTCTARMKGEAMDSGDKSCNKAQSAALKYATLQVFMIPTEGDNDADATTHEVAPRDATITQEQFNTLQEKAIEAGVSVETFCEAYKIEAVALLPARKFAGAIKKLNTTIAERAASAAPDRNASGSGEFDDVPENALAA